MDPRLSETIVAGAVLLGLHWVFLIVAFHSDRLDLLINGRVRNLITDGKVNRRRMRKARMNDRILKENLRVNGGVSDASEVKEADYLSS